jgi:hypothetical protein
MKKVSARTICTYTSPRTIQIMTNRISQSETTAGLKWDAFFYARLHLLTVLQCGQIIGEDCLYWCM